MRNVCFCWNDVLCAEALAESPLNAGYKGAVLKNVTIA